jgi:hypothetical protein
MPTQTPATTSIPARMTTTFQVVALEHTLRSRTQKPNQHKQIEERGYDWFVGVLTSNQKNKELFPENDLRSSI